MIEVVIFDTLYEDLALTLSCFQVKEITWESVIQRKTNAIVWKNLFKDQELIGKSSKVGFTKVIDGVEVG
jgi:hypothetical protein